MRGLLIAQGILVIVRRAHHELAGRNGLDVIPIEFVIESSDEGVLTGGPGSERELEGVENNSATSRSFRTLNDVEESPSRAVTMLEWFPPDSRVTLFDQEHEIATA